MFLVSEAPREFMYDPLKLDLPLADGKVVATSGEEKDRQEASTGARGADTMSFLLPLAADFHDALVGEYMAAFACFVSETASESKYDLPVMALPFSEENDVSTLGEEKDRVEASTADTTASVLLLTADFHRALVGEYKAFFLCLVSEAPREAIHDPLLTTLSFVVSGKVGTASGEEEEMIASDSRGADSLPFLLPSTTDFQEAVLGEYIAVFL
jgi:hypothetical protein